MNEQLNQNEPLREANVSSSASKRVAIIGHVNHGKTTLTSAIEVALKARKETIIVVQKKKPDITINGIGWNAKQDTKKVGNISSIVSFLATFNCFDSNVFGNSYQRNLPKGLDIIKEYGLIELKQSKLSKWERERVISIFEKNFERAD